VNDLETDVRLMRLTPQEFLHELCEGLAGYAALMQQCWGFIPAIKVKVESRLMVTIDFDIKDLPHNGRRFFLHPANEVKLSPEDIARLTVEEIYDHKATCADCGDGSVTLPDRIRERVLVPPDPLETLLFPQLARKLRSMCGKRSRICS
jgi:hypothetical protein